MTPTLSTDKVTAVAADLLMIPLPASHPWNGNAEQLDKALGGQLRQELRHQSFHGKEGEELLFQTHGALPARNIILSGTGGGNGPSVWYRLADSAARAARRCHARRVAIALGADATPPRVHALAEGFMLTRYTFSRYRTHTDAPAPVALTVVIDKNDTALRAAVQRSETTAAATSLARDLVNTPAGVLTPTALAAQAKQLARRGLTVTVHDDAAIRRLKMGALLGVAQGSAQKPRFIECVYRPAGKPRKRVALVGKGITFDSGGLSLKTAQAMQLQKRDMAGSAIVLGVMSALPELGLPLEVRGYIPATENMPSGYAIKPGDVVRACNGTTIEVLNTDAEGRLVLADALAYAARREPDLMLDFATLTGAVQAALGNRYAGIMGTNAELVRSCISAAAAVDEKLWELPLAPEYRHDLESQIADLKNTGEGHAGTIIGGLFLREFVGSIPWAHIDFSSTVMTEGHFCHPKGATGFGVRTVLHLLEQL